MEPLELLEPLEPLVIPERATAPVTLPIHPLFIHPFHFHGANHPAACWLEGEVDESVGVGSEFDFCGGGADAVPDFYELVG